MIYPETHRRDQHEKRTYDAAFNNFLLEGRRLAWCEPPIVTVDRQPPDGGATYADFELSALAVVSPLVQVQIGGGVPRTIYRLVFRGHDNGDPPDTIELVAHFRAKPEV